jgi:hypothetical protein
MLLGGLGVAIMIQIELARACFFCSSFASLGREVVRSSTSETADLGATSSK